MQHLHTPILYMAVCKLKVGSQKSTPQSGTKARLSDIDKTSLLGSGRHSFCSSHHHKRSLSRFTRLLQAPAPPDRSPAYVFLQWTTRGSKSPSSEVESRAQKGNRLKRSWKRGNYYNNIWRYLWFETLLTLWCVKSYNFLEKCNIGIKRISPKPVGFVGW